MWIVGIFNALSSLSLSLSLYNTSTFPETSPCTRYLALKCSLSLSSHQFDCSLFPSFIIFSICYKNSLCSSISFAGRRSKQYISNSIWDKCLKWDKPPILQQRKNHVSNDIIFNSILTRVPVKSLMRFRCVCKSWDSSITTPNFISTHLYNNKNKHPHHHNNANGYVKHMPSLPSSSNISVCTVAYDRTFDRIYETEIPSDFVHVHVVGSCNGL